MIEEAVTLHNRDVAAQGKMCTGAFFRMKEDKMSRFISKRFAQMVPYRLGEQPKNMEFIKLNSNETLIPPSEGVYESLQKAADHADLGHYSDQDATVLREAIATHYGVATDEVFAGNGADEVLSFIMLAYGMTPEGLCFPDITYGFYKTVSGAFGLNYREIPLDENFRIRAADYERAGQLIIIANPNAPTGLQLSQKEIRRIIESNRDHVVVIDEAYVDFGTRSCIPLIHEYDNLIVVHTMSKSRNIAAIHVGYAIGQAALMRELNNLKNCFNPNNINQVTLDAAVAAMQDFETLERSVLEKIKIRIWFTRQLERMGYETLDSFTNFVFTRHEGYDAQELTEFLYEEGILVRHYDQPRIRDFVRISIGTAGEMEKVTESLLKFRESIRTAKRASM